MQFSLILFLLQKSFFLSSIKTPKYVKDGCIRKIIDSVPFVTSRFFLSIAYQFSSVSIVSHNKKYFLLRYFPFLAQGNRKSFFRFLGWKVLIFHFWYLVFSYKKIKVYTFVESESESKICWTWMNFYMKKLKFMIVVIN